MEVSPIPSCSCFLLLHCSQLSSPRRDRHPPTRDFSINKMASSLEGDEMIRTEGWRLEVEAIGSVSYTNETFNRNFSLVNTELGNGQSDTQMLIHVETYT